MYRTLSHPSIHEHHAYYLFKDDVTLREMGHAGVVGPHCVSSSREHLHLLSFDQSGHVLLKLYDEMVVKDSSCQ